MDDVIKDERFSHIAKDPRFWQMPKKEKKVKIDQRFKAMFSDKKFQVKYTIDKRGRPINTSSKDNLKRFYDISDNSEDDETGNESKKTSKKTGRSNNKEVSLKQKQGNKQGFDACLNKNKQVSKGNKSTKYLKNSTVVKKESKETSDIEIDLNEDVEIDSNEENVGDKSNQSSSCDSEGDEEDSDSDVSDEEIDRARGIGDAESSSSEEEFEFDGDDKFDHNWMELAKDIPEIKDASYRLAICNLDWDRTKAEDIFMMLNSFKPSGGYIQSVSIYPSEFGKERMREEELQGPKELTEKTENEFEQTSDEVLEGDQFHREKLREYEMNRLKYYYAVVVCDSKNTAIKLYDDCDGLEVETSCTKLDLRFIPDDMTFDDEVKNVCTGVTEYKPNYFANSALGRSQVKLTWDDTDHDRLKVTMSKIDPKKIDCLEKDYEAYIASSSDEEDAGLPGSNSSDSDGETDESRLKKYRQLLQDLDNKKNEKEDDVEMEITWEPGLKGATESLVKKSQESEQKITPWNNYLQKKKEKKKQRKKDRKSMKEKSLIESGEIPEEKAAFSDDEIPEGVDLSDSYFKSEFKDTKKVKKKKGKKEELTEEEIQQKKQEEAKLALLMMDEEDQRKHFTLEKLLKDGKKKNKKNKKQTKDDEQDEKTDNFQVNVGDERFSALFDSHLFNVDPSAPEFKKTKGTEAFINEKQQRRRKEGYSRSIKRKASDPVDSLTDELKPKQEESILSLVKSVKSKTQKFQDKRKKVS